MSKYWFVYFVPLLVFLAACGGESIDPEGIDDIPFVTDHFAVDDQGNTYLTGFDQVNRNNRDPFIHKKNSRGETLWRLRYEETTFDGRGALIAWQEGKLFAVLTTNGDSTGAASITATQALPGAFEGVFQTSYGRVFGPRVTVLVEIDPETGKIKKGTFLTSRLTDGNTNFFLASQIGFSEGRIVIRATSGVWPPGAGTTFVRFPDTSEDDAIDDAFWLRYEINPDFSAITKAEVLQEPF